mmetsp:Transcript_105417/g.267851  ORF Transcript_105417/g.267851 Transcript_105417/m.267851 type:complete len:282 (+) Transcript_105417:2-847(+)
MRAVAGATDSCAFALPVVLPGAEISFDVAHVEGVPELALAVRNPVDGHGARGLPAEETWTLVASPEWTDAVRPDAKARWDKNKVSDQMIDAFASLTGCGRGRALRAPYHWGGYASLTRCSTSSFALDADVGLAFVGDFFVGHGADAALQAGAALASHLMTPAAGSLLPAPRDWVPRSIPEGAEDTGALWGRPAGTDDHSWPTVELLATGVLPKGKGCMDRYRRRNVRSRDVAELAALSGQAGSATGATGGGSGSGGNAARARWRGRGGGKGGGKGSGGDAS